MIILIRIGGLLMSDVEYLFTHIPNVVQLSSTTIATLLENNERCHKFLWELSNFVEKLEKFPVLHLKLQSDIC